MLDIRYLPRIDAEIPVRILDQQGNVSDACISNISPGGVMIVVDEKQKFDITGNAPNALSARVIELEIECDLPGQPKTFEAECRLVFIRRLSQHEFHLGFRFFNLSNEMAKLLNGYVDKHTDPLSNLARNSSAQIPHQDQHHRQPLRKQQA